jgi:hypothetical protein
MELPMTALMIVKAQPIVAQEHKLENRWYLLAARERWHCLLVPLMCQNLQLMLQALRVY